MGEINLDPLERALQQLEKGLERSKVNPDDEELRDAVIQRFEYSMDLCWKMLQRYFKVIAQIDEANIRTKKDLFREAGKVKLIVDAESWIWHYEARNESSHTSNADVAKSVYERAKLFLPDARSLLESLRRAS